MNLLRLVAWIVLLIIAVSIAYALFASREPYAYPPQQVPWTQSLLSLEQRLYCTDSVYIDPWTAVNSYGVSIENNEVVLKYTNTALEAEKVLSDASIDPELYYYYYSILTALVAEPRGSYSTIYELHPLPVSQSDEEGLAGESLCFYLPDKGFDVPAVRPALTTDTPFVDGVNIATYMPSANISVVTTLVHDLYVDVYGYASADIDVSTAGVESYGPYCYEYSYEVGNTTYTYTHCYSYIYTVYDVSYSYVFGVLYNDTIDAEMHSGVFRHVASWIGGAVYSYREGGFFKGYGPFARAWIEAKNMYSVYGGCEKTNTSIYCDYTYEYHADFMAREETRSARFWRAVLGLDASIDKIFTGVLPMNLYIYNGSHSFKSSVDEHILYTSSSWPWEEKRGGVLIDLEDRTSICNRDSRCIDFVRRINIAEINTVFSRGKVYSWGWGTSIDIYPEIDVDVKQSFPRGPEIDIERVKASLEPNPGEIWLEKLVLMYIHDIIKQFINSDSAMASYAQAFLWLLATQMPVNMGLCDTRGSSTPLLDALCKKCGSETERVEMLCNVTGYSLESWTKNASMHWPSYNGSTANTTICVAKISGYPSLWELYSKAKNIVYAKPVDGGYTVFYNIYENSPFGDWRRVKD